MLCLLKVLSKLLLSVCLYISACACSCVRACVHVSVHVWQAYLHPIQHCSEQWLHVFGLLGDSIDLTDELVPEGKIDRMMRRAICLYGHMDTPTHSHATWHAYIQADICTYKHTYIHTIHRVTCFSFTTLLNTLVLLGKTKPEGTMWYKDCVVDSKLTTSTWRLWKVTSLSW